MGFIQDIDNLPKLPIPPVDIQGIIILIILISIILYFVYVDNSIEPTIKNLASVGFIIVVGLLILWVYKEFLNTEAKDSYSKLTFVYDHYRKDISDRCRTDGEVNNIEKLIKESMVDNQISNLEYDNIVRVIVKDYKEGVECEEHIHNPNIIKLMELVK